MFSYLVIYCQEIALTPQLITPYAKQIQPHYIKVNANQYTWDIRKVLIKKLIFFIKMHKIMLLKTFFILSYDFYIK